MGPNVPHIIVRLRVARDGQYQRKPWTLSNMDRWYLIQRKSKRLPKSQAKFRR
jgi:hypothetical protein